jgi:hypothetical protein
MRMRRERQLSSLGRLGSLGSLAKKVGVDRLRRREFCADDQCAKFQNSRAT